MLYKDGDVSIDETFARFGSKSYAIDKINSVDIRHKVRGGCAWVFAGIIGLFLLLMAIFAGKDGSFASAVVIGGLGLGALYWALRAHRESEVCDYTLYLTTSSSEAQAMQTTDRDEIHLMRAAIESAMAAKR